MVRGVTIGLLASFILGIASGPFFAWQNPLAPWWLLIGLVSLIIIYRRHFSWLLGLAAVILIVLGNLRFAAAQLPDDDRLAELSGEVVELTGQITSDPAPGRGQTKLTVEVRQVNSQETAGRILVTTAPYPEFSYGQMVSLVGRLDRPVNRGKFDYVGYLARLGITATINYPEIIPTSEFNGQPVLAWLYGTKRQMIASIQRSLTEPAAGLLAGLLFGVKSELSSDLTENFNRTGLTHIIALSGFNITIIAAGMLWLLRFLPLSWRHIVAVFLIILFVLMTGASPSVTRAAIMGILVLWAGLTGRLADSGVALLLAAAMMLALNPLVLYHDIGFQLSFAATVGIVYFSSVFNDLFRRWPRWLSACLSPTLSALVFSSPLLVYHFERFSLIAPVANLLVLPLIAPAMAIGVIGLVLGLVAPAAGLAFGLIAAWPLNYIAGVATLLGELPAASIEAKINSVGWVIVAYLILGGGLIFKLKHAPKASLELHPAAVAR